MMLNKLPILLLILMTPTSISAFSSFSCDHFLIARIRTLMFGNYVVLSKLSYSSHFPDLVLFLFDVASDICNGIIFIDKYNLTWGWTVLGIMLLPMVLVYALAALFLLLESSSWCEVLFILLIAPILAPIAVPSMTVAYIVFVTYVFARKCLQPAYIPNDYNNGNSAGFLKLLEAFLVASVQAIVGWVFLHQNMENCFQLRTFH